VGGQLSSILRDIGITTRKFGLLGHIYAEPGIVLRAGAPLAHHRPIGARRSAHSSTTGSSKTRQLMPAPRATCVTPKGAKPPRRAQSPVRARRVLAERLPGVAASLDGIRAGIV
jgi:hypothetical protein